MPDSTILFVSPRSDGKWDVKEQGLEKAIAYLNTKSEAVKYAEEFAKRKTLSEVKILDEERSVEEERIYSSGERKA
jgi:Uncharacterized protein conserved in bacteria (DUF2188)